MSKPQERKEILGLQRITKKRILELCKRDKLYQTPSLNDVLYLHYQGFECIEGLEEYTELKCLWLECNAISEIQGLENQTKLKCLFLQSNLIKRIENLNSCRELDTLNLSQNHIHMVENCSSDILPSLNTLNLASNYIKDFEGLKELEYCENLSVLDLSNNRIDDILVVKIFSKMPELKVLVLQGNPVVSKIPQYRKTLILECEKLTYLDSRPVFDKDRACAEAWKRGGYEEERKESKRWVRKERKKITDSVNATIRMRNKYRKIEDQLELIPSSESDEETVKAKHICSNDFNEDYDMFNEVTEDNILDMNTINSSDNIIISTINKPNEIISSMAEISTTQIVQDSVNCGINKSNNQFKCTEEIVVNNVNLIFNENSAKSNELNKIEKLDEYKICNDSKTFMTLNSTDLSDSTQEKKFNNSNDDEFDDQYNETINTICRICRENNAEFESHESDIKNLKISSNESIDLAEFLHEDVVYEHSKDLEVAMSILDETSQSKNQYTCVNQETNDIIYENTENTVNQEIENNFKELSTNMEDYFNEINNYQEERENNNINNKNIIEYSSSDSNDSDFSSNEIDDVLDEIIKNTIHYWNKKNSDILNKRLKIESEKIIPEIWLNDKPISNDNSVETIEHINSFINNNKNNFKPLVQRNIESSGIATPFTLEKKSNSKSIYTVNIKMNNCDNISEAKSENLLNDEFEYKPLDLQYLMDKSNESLKNEYEKKTNELSELLQKLEYENERLYGNFNEAISNFNNDNTENIAKFLCKKVINDIIDNLEIKKTIPKSINTYELGYIETDEEDSYSCYESKQEDETVTPTRTIKEVIESFNAFVRKITTSNREELYEEYRKRKRINSSDEEKKASLQLLLQEANNVNKFHNDNHESLDAQLDVFKENENNRVKDMVERVYAQKNRYDDTLEVIDDKLVIIKKDTGDIEELSKYKTNYINNDEDSSDYHTAQSDSEDDIINNNKSLKIDNNQEISTKLNENINYNIYKSVDQKSSMQMILNQLYDNRNFDENQGYSSDDNNTIDSLTKEFIEKPTLFGNIDKEFFDKLDLEKVNFTADDENHLVQCAHSYEELRKILTLNKDERYLNKEDNVLIQQMIEHKKNNTKNSENSDLNDTDDNLIVKECKSSEDLLLKKMIQKTKDKIASDNLNQMNNCSNNLSNNCENFKQINKFTNLTTSSGIKLYEYKSDFIKNEILNENENENKNENENQIINEQQTADFDNENKNKLIELSKDVFTFVYQYKNDNNYDIVHNNDEIIGNNSENKINDKNENDDDEKKIDETTNNNNCKINEIVETEQFSKKNHTDNNNEVDSKFQVDNEVDNKVDFDSNL